MGQQIIVQPDGKLAIFSTITDTLIVTDATEEEIVEWRAEQAADMARMLTRNDIAHALSNDPDSPYRTKLTWEQAVELNGSW